MAQALSSAWQMTLVNILSWQNVRRAKVALTKRPFLRRSKLWLWQSILLLLFLEKYLIEKNDLASFDLSFVGQVDLIWRVKTLWMNLKADVPFSLSFFLSFFLSLFLSFCLFVSFFLSVSLFFLSVSLFFIFSFSLSLPFILSFFLWRSNYKRLFLICDLLCTSSGQMLATNLAYLPNWITFLHFATFTQKKLSRWSCHLRQLISFDSHWTS